MQTCFDLDWGIALGARDSQRTIFWSPSLEVMCLGSISGVWTQSLEIDWGVHRIS